MKIIQHPPAEENWSIKVFCTGFGHSNKGCGAKLKVYREDLRYRPQVNGTEAAVTFKCICCGKLNDIGIQDYPPEYKNLKPYKKKWLNANTTQHTSSISVSSSR